VCTNFSKFWEKSQSLGRLKGDMKKLHTEDSKMLGSAVQSLVPTVVWCPIFFSPLV